MHKDSSKSAIGLLCIIAILESFVCSGCRNRKDARRVVVEAMCRNILESEETPERTKKLAETVMRNWANKSPDRQPILLRATSGRRYDGSDYILVLDMSDEEFDVAGFKVREVHASEANAVVIEEEYRVFPENRIGNPQILRLTVRETISQRMNENEWRAYMQLAANERLATYRRGGYPEIKVSLPMASRIDVEISIFDSSGRNSEPVPLEDRTRDSPGEALY